MFLVSNAWTSFSWSGASAAASDRSVNQAHLWRCGLRLLPLAGLQEGRDGGYLLLQLALLRLRLLQLAGQVGHATGPPLQLLLQAAQAHLELCGHRTRHEVSALGVVQVNCGLQLGQLFCLSFN